MAETDELGVGLADAIDKVRSELETAIDLGKRSPVGFVPGEVELDFELGFARSGGGGAAVRLWVVSVGAKGEMSRSGTHRLKVALTPKRRGEPGDETIGSTANQ